MNAQPDAHPRPQDLAAFGLGRLSAVDSEVVAGHLEHCEPCRKVVESVPADSLLALLKATRSGAEAVPDSGPPAQAPAKPITTLNTGSESSVASGPNRTGPWASRPLSGVEIPPELVDHPRYRIIRMLGRGGMGAVYLAEHIVMRQPRALKVVVPEFVANPQAVQRFRREIETAARLQHPNVVHAYDAEQSGQTHFLVMEYVHGIDLSTLMKKKGPLPVAHSCHFIRQAALGLQHARKHRMVHRDIKPHNLILAKKGLVKILDFGLAKIASEAATEVGGPTREGAVMGTPDYMAPEQWEDAKHADIRADIYSLGCTLYALLAGAPPFQVATGVLQKMTAHLQKQPRPLTELRPDVPSELWEVVARMLAKHPAQRFQKPLDVALALVPFIKSGGTPRAPTKSLPVPELPSPGKPTMIPADANELRQLVPEMPDAAEPQGTPLKGVVSPNAESEASPDPPSKGKHAKQSTRTTPPRSYRRWQILACVALALVLLGLATLWAAGAFRLKTSTGDVLAIWVNEPTPDILVEGEKVTVKWEKGGTQAEIMPAPDPGKVQVRKDGFTVTGQDVEVKDGKRILRVTLERASEAAAKPMPPLDYDLTAGHRFVHFGPEGTRVVLKFNNWKENEYYVRIYNLDTGKAISPPLIHDALISFAWFSSDGTRLVTGGRKSDGTPFVPAERKRGPGTWRVWDAVTGRSITPPLTQDTMFVGGSFSPDGRRVATVNADGARVWDAQTGQPLTPFLLHEPGKSVGCAMFNPDGQRLVTSSTSQTRVWNAQTGQPITPLLNHDQAGVLYTSFSPDGKRVVTCGMDGTARLWDAHTGALIPPLLIQDQAWLLHASFSPNGKRVATAGGDIPRTPSRNSNMARVWDAETGQTVAPPLRHDQRVNYVTFSPSGARVVTASMDKTARVWDAVTGQPLTPPLLHDGIVRYATFSPDGKGVVTASDDARLWDAESGKELKRVSISKD